MLAIISRMPKTRNLKWSITILMNSAVTELGLCVAAAVTAPKMLDKNEVLSHSEQRHKFEQCSSTIH
eukprot:gene3671-biopygen12161